MSASPVWSPYRTSLAPPKVFGARWRGGASATAGGGARGGDVAERGRSGAQGPPPGARRRGGPRGRNGFPPEGAARARGAGGGEAGGGGGGGVGWWEGGGGGRRGPRGRPPPRGGGRPAPGWGGKAIAKAKKGEAALRQQIDSGINTFRNSAASAGGRAELVAQIGECELERLEALTDTELAG